MICTFIEHIIIFMSITHHHSIISEEKAKSLLQAALHIIQQDNWANKHQRRRNTCKRHPQTKAQNNAPTKTLLLEPQEQIPPFTICPSAVALQEIPRQIKQETAHKFSTEESRNQGIELSPQEDPKACHKDQNRKGSTFQVLIQASIHDGKIEQDKKQSIQKYIVPQEASNPTKYSQSDVKELKRDLEISSRGKICRSQEINTLTGEISGYTFHCKNNMECPYQCSLIFTGQRNPKGERIYRLLIKCKNHLQACIEDEQELAFMKLTKLIDSMQVQIVNLLSQREALKPKEILTIIAQKLGEDNHKFIYKNLKEKSYIKAAKKYFDNLIYKVKCQIGVI